MDEQDTAEQFDAFDDETEGISLDEVPSESMWGAQAYGAGGTETPDSVAARAAREEPDRFQADEVIAGGLLADDDDLDGESIAMEGDERGTPSAEEAAMHVLTDDEAILTAGLDLDGPLDDGYMD